MTVAGAVRAHQVAQLLVGEPVIDRDERLAGQRRAEQGDRDGLGVEVDHGHLLAGQAGQHGAGPPGAGGQFGHGGAVGQRAERDPVAHAVGGHLEEHPDVHVRRSVRGGQRFGVLEPEVLGADGERLPRPPWSRAARVRRSRRCTACRSACSSSNPGSGDRPVGGSSPMGTTGWPPQRRSTASAGALMTTISVSPTADRNLTPGFSSTATDVLPLLHVPQVGTPSDWAASHAPAGEANQPLRCGNAVSTGDAGRSDAGSAPAIYYDVVVTWRHDPDARTARPVTDLHRPVHPVRFVTAASLFDGHDAAINIMRRLLQAQGVEVVHLGHNRSVDEVVRAVVEEDAQGVAVSSYQGGHTEYFRYLVDRLRAEGRPDVLVYGGGGGVIVAAEIEELEAYGVRRIFSPADGQRLGLDRMINILVEECDRDLAAGGPPTLESLRSGDRRALARWITFLESGAVDDDVVGSWSTVPGASRSRCSASPGRVAPASPPSPTN